MEIAKLYHKISVCALQKKSSNRISPFHAVQISDNSGAFSVWPNIIPEKSLHCGVMMGHWPNFTPNYGVMMSRWIFSVLFELIIVNWNPFQRWFSEVAPVSWHINFISRSYGWGVRARFVICGCSLPHLTNTLFLSQDIKQNVLLSTYLDNWWHRKL